ncbi:butyrate kinase [Desulfovibrio sp. OttesenSCG-928-C14]|nr:butyrate kinase [Desulfovibrio sp. OttesenSCG-928-C14]
MHRILVLNIGGTSTKMAVYNDDTQIWERTLRHSKEEMAPYPDTKSQFEYRKNMMVGVLAEGGFGLDDFDVLAIRGLELKHTFKHGTYLVTEAMRAEVDDVYQPDQPMIHAGRLIVHFADALFPQKNIPVYMTNPATINEMIPEARLAGHPAFERIPTFHALNTCEQAIRLAEKMGKTYADCNFVMVHMGGGVSVSAHQHGRVTDANHCAWGEGPFSLDRAGTLPTDQLLRFCYSGKYSREEATFELRAGSGVKAYLGTMDLREVEKMIDAGDAKADLVLRALAYQIAKEIGAYCAAIEGKVDAIVLTAGMSNSKKLTGLIRARVEKFAPVEICADELEIEALIAGTMRVLRGEEEAIVYGA